jgi:hypothetical protein
LWRLSRLTVIHALPEFCSMDFRISVAVAFAQRRFSLAAIPFM